MDLEQKKGTLYDNGTAVWDVTNLSTVGLATARVLENAQKFRNQIVYINSFTGTQNEMIAALEKATGTKFALQQGSAEELTAKGREKLAAGDQMAGLDLIFGAFYRGGQDLMHHSAKNKLANDELGLPKEDLETTVRQVVSEGRPKNPW